MAPKTFNNVIIGQFALTGVTTKVYVNGRFLIITSADDVENPLLGFGMDEHGQMIQFKYPEVEFISMRGNNIDIDTYNKGMETLHAGDEAPADKEPEDEEEEGEEEEEEEDAPDQPPMSDNYSPNGTLLEISKDVLKAKLDVIKKQSKELKDKESALKKEPIEDGYISEYTFGTGDIVKNINPKCKHFGSKGIVYKIMDLSKEMGKVIVYTVTNSGNTFKPGDKLTKTAEQLEKI